MPEIEEVVDDVVPEATPAEAPTADIPVDSPVETESTEPPVNTDTLDPATEKKLVEEAQQFKEQGNALFRESKFTEALEAYNKALSTCPQYLKEPRAIYLGNISACYVYLEKYQDAVDTCTKALELDPKHTKVRSRRALANEKLGKWAALESALEDLALLRDEADTPKAKNDYTKRIQKLEPKLKEQQQNETEEMMGKLKDLGNGLLKNFGLSLDNFNMAQNAEGGYSLNFGQK